MTNLTWAQVMEILPYIALVVGVVVTWKRATGRVGLEALEGYRAQVEQLKGRVSEGERLHHESLGEIGKLRGIIEEKDKRMMILETVSIDKNPQMNSFMQEMTHTMKEISSFMQLINGHFEQAKGQLKVS